MESNLLQNNKTFASRIEKRFVSTVFYINGKILTISLILFLNCSKLLFTKWLIVITQIDIGQHGPFTLYNSNIKADYLFWFPKLLQEYILRSTYPSLKIVKNKPNISTFLFFYEIVYTRKEKLPLLILKRFFYTNFYTSKIY